MSQALFVAPAGHASVVQRALRLATLRLATLRLATLRLATLRLATLRLATLLLATMLVFGCSSAQQASDLAPRSDAALASTAIARDAIRCNGRQVWNRNLRADVRAAVAEIVQTLQDEGVVLPADRAKAIRKKLRKRVMWRQIRNLLLAGQYNNLGVIALPSVKTADGRPVLLFRSGFTPQPGDGNSCFASLVRAAGVRHVANLYAGPMRTSDLEKGEQAVVAKAGGTYYLARDASDKAAEWREHLRASDGKANAQKEAMKAVAAIINDSLLRPGGKAPTGNLHVHCGGGMHRTGMVVGIIDRCLNGTDEASWTADYKRHVGWRSTAEPGGFEDDNVAFIRAFDCSLLKR